MDPKSILKGKIAEDLARELLEKNGFHVYLTSHKKLLEELEQTEEEFSWESKTGRKISSIPDYLVFIGNRPCFVEVKFRSDPESLEEVLLIEKEYLEKYWEAKILIITSKEKPYFRIVSPPYFSKEKKEGWPIPVLNWLPLQDDPDLKIKEETIEQFEKLVEQYYTNK
jgi:Holliday junction resolvase-like predicted endonuclease